MFQNRTFLSREPVATIFPDGLNAAAVTGLSCAIGLKRDSPVFAVQIRAVVKMQRDPSVEGYLRRLELAAPSTDPLRRIDERTRQAILADMRTELQPYLVEDGLALPAPIHLATARK